MADVPYVLELQTATSGSVVTRQEVKDFVRVDHCDEDDIFSRAIDAAVRSVERATGKQLLTATYDLKLRCFPGTGGRIEFPRMPVASVSQITYVDTGSQSQTLSSSLYSVDLGSSDVPGHVEPAYNLTWPSARGFTRGDVTVRFVCGFGASSDIPDTLRHLVILQAGHLYETRHPICCGNGGGVVPLCYDLLMEQETWHELV